MTRRFIPSYTDEELFKIQTEGLRWTMHQAEKSPQYRVIFRKAGVCADDIRSLDDLPKLPTIDADDLRRGYPLPLLCVPDKDVVRIHASSGTTGKRKILAYTAKDVSMFYDQMARCFEMAGLTPQDRVQMAVGYGLWTAGAGFQGGCERFGAMTIPVGPGNLQIHLQLLQDMGATCFCATASWLSSWPRKWIAPASGTKSNYARSSAALRPAAKKCALPLNPSSGWKPATISAA